MNITTSDFIDTVLEARIISGGLAGQRVLIQTSASEFSDVRIAVVDHRRSDVVLRTTTDVSNKSFQMFIDASNSSKAVKIVEDILKSRGIKLK